MEMKMAVTQPKLNHPRPKALWQSIMAEYDLEDYQIDLLAGACVALNRAEEAASVLEREGLTVQTKHGVRAHPCNAIERDNRNLHAKYMRQLGLDVDNNPAIGPGRPPHSTLYNHPNGRRK